MSYHSKPLSLLSPVKETPELQAAMESFLHGWLPKHELPENKLLYHYTNLAGLRGILESRSLWCGHSSSLNDPLEIQYGQQFVVNIIGEYIKVEDRRDIRNFLGKMLVNIEAFGKYMFHVFVACFCESGNLLSQWRGYTENGKGYCVGMQFSGSTGISSDPSDLKVGKPLYLRKVVYDKKEHEKLVKSYMDQVIIATKTVFDSEVSKTFSYDKAYCESMMAMQAANVIFDMLLSFKHSAFESEEEWRLVRVTPENDQPEELKFRETSSGLIPYRPTYIFDSMKDKSPIFPLRSVCFGPMLEPIRTRSAIELLLHHIAADSHPIGLTPHLVKISGPGYSLR